MSYNIAINGHKDTDDPQAFEQEVVDEARKLVEALDGVTSAQVSTGTLGTSTGTLGTVNLLSEDST